ncbi:MAG: hypothetical protein CMK32_04660 [Porticoccaceae bacterium]|nr:hypothetical protein [Porticoccaceae bacterium]
MTAYLILFGSAFLAATVLPFYSEFTLYMLADKGHSPWLLLATATLGNTLGSVVNWLLGIFLLHFKDRRWFYFSDRQIERAQHWFNHYGIWTLLFAWLPLGGDALTLIAGIMRVRLWIFLILVAIGKGARYAAVLWAIGP